MDAYNAYIATCKAPKSQEKVMRIVRAILDFLRQGLTTDQIACELNRIGVSTLQDKAWNYYSLQMQITKMARLDADSSLAWGFTLLWETGEANELDLSALRGRTRLLH